MNEYLDKEKILACIIAAFGKNFELDNLDITKETDAVRLTLNGTAIRVSTRGKVDQIEGSFLVSNTLCELVEYILSKHISKAFDAELAS